jgi:ketosteroid isomerase-like protein
LSVAGRHVDIDPAEEAFNRGDLETAAASLHPEIEWHVTFRLPDLPVQDVYRGREEVLALWRELTSVLDFEIRTEEVLHTDEERLLRRMRFVGRGIESGIEIDRIVYLAYRVREGLIQHSRGWEDEASARHSLGLDP